MAGYLMCDAAGCDHEESCEGYGPEMIGKACPKCGESLLTQEDFDAFEPTRLMMEVLIEAGLASNDGMGVKSPVNLSLNQHGGKLKIEIDTTKSEREE